MGKFEELETMKQGDLVHSCVIPDIHVIPKERNSHSE